MSGTNRELPPETVSVDVHHDRLCDRYEFFRKAGQSVTVGAFLHSEGIDPAAAPAGSRHRPPRVPGGAIRNVRLAPRVRPRARPAAPEAGKQAV